MIIKGFLGTWKVCTVFERLVLLWLCCKKRKRGGTIHHNSRTITTCFVLKLFCWIFESILVVQEVAALSYLSYYTARSYVMLLWGFVCFFSLPTGGCVLPGKFLPEGFLEKVQPAPWGTVTKLEKHRQLCVLSSRSLTVLLEQAKRDFADYF